MFVTNIHVRKNGYGAYDYGKKDPSAPYIATIETVGDHGKVELRLSPELSSRIVEVIADEVAKSGRATANMLVADVLATAQLPAPEVVS